MLTCLFQRRAVSSQIRQYWVRFLIITWPQLLWLSSRDGLVSEHCHIVTVLFVIYLITVYMRANFANLLWQCQSLSNWLAIANHWLSMPCIDQTSPNDWQRSESEPERCHDFQMVNNNIGSGRQNCTQSNNYIQEYWQRRPDQFGSVPMRSNIPLTG